MTDTTWRELFPDGRTIFYEGDDPQEFVQQIKAEFGFDPSEDPGWGEHSEGNEGTPEGALLKRRMLNQPSWSFTREELDSMPFPPHTSYRFHCPPEHLDAIYGGDRFPMGS